MTQDNTFRTTPLVPTTLSETLELVAANGYSAIPVRAGEKRPCIRHWDRACRDPAPAGIRAEWLQAYPNAGLGIAMHGLLVVDIDYSDAERANELAALVEQALGSTPLVRVGQPPKLQLWYGSTFPVRTRRRKGVDLLGNGSFSVAYNIHPLTKAPYSWPRHSPLDVPRAELPVVDPTVLDRLWTQLGRTSPSGDKNKGLPGRSDAVQDRPDDGRDEILYRCVLQVHAQGERNPGKLGAAAFALFQTRADLARPRSRDGQPWQVKHAIEKAASVLRHPSPSAQRVSWPGDRKHRFAQSINAACALGGLPRAAAKVSHAMLAYVGPRGACWTSIARLVGDTGLHERTVQHARELLVTAGFWFRRRDLDTGFVLYLPNPEIAGE